MMFSNKDAFVLQEENDYQFLFGNYLRNVVDNYSLEAALLCDFDQDTDEIRILVSYNISTAPLLGAKKDIFIEMIKDCFSNYPKPHIHKISHEFVKTLKKIEPSKVFGFHILFLPLLYNGNRYLFLGFPQKTKPDTIPERIYSDLNIIVAPIDSLIHSERLQSYIQVLQNYVKEVGHDISSSVQATIAKLRNISKGIYAGDMVKKKAREAEEEILGAFRTAENLGITVDPNYNLKEAKYFDLMNVAENVVELYKSEANERHIDIRLNKSVTKLEVLGDRNGLESAIGQLLFNAIKYAFGSSYINLIITSKVNDVCVTVINKGIPLYEDEIGLIWNFGYRGRNAYERHVNGAGIGLYTVKKIIEAHGGKVSAKSSLASSSIIIFSFEFPIEEALKKNILL